ncbi:MAG: sugar ABC transporter permease [Candidatus Dormibacteraeota bacterium]|nr:sugar ABC transporter permease [Candidatus Dormibacteraeota bacterium]
MSATADDVTAPAPGSFTAWRRGLRERVTQGDVGSLPVILALILIWAVFQYLNPNFLSPRNLTNLILQITSMGTIAVGIVLVLLLGEIDLSAGSVSGLAASVMAVLNIKNHVPAPLAIGAAVATGAAIGALQGAWFARFRIPSFVVTLAGLVGWVGVQLLVLGETGTLNVLDPTIDNLTLNFLSIQAGWALAVVALAVVALDTFLVRRRRAAAGLDLPPLPGALIRLGLIAALVLVSAFVLNSDRGVPEAFLILLGFVVFFHYVTTRTRFGRYIYAVGGNAEAARRAGISVNTIRVAVFTLGGVMAASGGIMAASRLLAVNQSSGSGDVLLNAIAAAVIGGTSLFGGRGSVWAAMTGALVIGSISNGMDLLAYSSAIKFMVTGAVLLAAVTIDAVARQGRQAAGRA